FGGANGCPEDAGKFVRLSEEVGHQLRLNQVRANGHTNPVSRFTYFLPRDAELVNEIGSALRPACLLVVSPRRSPAPQQLSADMFPSLRPGKRFYKLDDSHRVFEQPFRDVVTFHGPLPRYFSFSVFGSRLRGYPGCMGFSFSVFSSRLRGYP